MPNVWNNLPLEIIILVVSSRQLATVSTSLNTFADNEVQSRRVGGVNAPVGSRDPVYNFLCCSAAFS